MARSTMLSSRSYKKARRNRLAFLIFVALITLAGAGWWVYSTIRSTIETRVEETLKTILDADVEALRFWLESQKAETSVLAEDPRVVGWVEELLTGPLPRHIPGPDSSEESAQEESLGRFARSRCRAVQCIDFIVISRSGELIASLHPEPLGTSVSLGARESFEQALEGKAAISLPYLSSVPVRVPEEDVPRRRPTMLLMAPVRSSDGEKILAVMALRIRPEEGFTRILHIARPGDTGETYAFGPDGLMLSDSRFDEELRKLGLLGAGQADILNVQIRDPGGDLRAGYKPTMAREAQPLTSMAERAVLGEPGVDVEGYRDYRGVRVVGAWTWLSDYGFGVATEEDAEEAYAPLGVLARAFGVLFALLVVSAGVVIFSSQWIQLLARRLNRAQKQARRMGQYTLKERIGRGGMGEVYLASHALLRRPTAVKLLRPEKTDAETLARFEQEVQITSSLTHPNTIAIYDYGHTPEGLFYYAMEYLDGITLQELIQELGPLNSSRTIYILMQACGSLAEAHDIGFVHRDIKPANLFVGVQGGQGDFVKILDFGLVKSLDSTDPGLTKAGRVAGTPLYLSPEAIQNPSKVDARSDLYGLGCVAYFLVTGETVFTSQDALTVCYDHVHTTPLPPSRWIGEDLDPDFEQIIMELLAKDPDQRPRNARDLAERLSECSSAQGWGLSDANRWWAENRKAVRDLSPRQSASVDRMDVLMTTRKPLRDPQMSEMVEPGP